MIHVWSWFVEIIDGIKADGMGPSMIGWADLAAWCELTGEVIEPWEARLLIRLSAKRAAVLSEKTSNHGHQLQV